MRRLKKSQFGPIGISACLGGALIAGAPASHAEAVETGNEARIEKLEKENLELRKRLDALEGVHPKDVSSGGGPTNFLKTLTSSSLSGFVTASYFYDTSTPSDNSPNGYLWNRHHNSFTLNKVKLTLASAPAEHSGDHWSAGYRASLIFGEDAPIVNTGGNTQGLAPLREAYAEVNVPIGTGLNVKAGQLISLLNFESGDGGAVNPNFSQGNQWFFTGNGPSAGVQLGYALSEKVDVKVRVQNGMFTGFIDNNPYKTFMGSLGIKPDSKTAISLIGFGGREGASSSQWLKGGSLIASRQLTEKYNLNFATELDYFNLDLPGKTTDWWSAGGWLWSDLTPTLGVALRADYLKDSDGFGTSGLLGFPANPGMDLVSATFTVDYHPVPNIKIKPEVRYDHTSLNGGFDGKEHRFIVGAGVSYLF
jgi:hypothetical protein